MAYVRTVETASGATAVQIVWSWRRVSRSIEHIGSAHDEAQLAVLKTAAAVRLAAGQTKLDLGLSDGLEPGTLPITSSQMTYLRDGLCTAYRVLGFEVVTKATPCFVIWCSRGSSTAPATKGPITEASLGVIGSPSPTALDAVKTRK